MAKRLKFGLNKIQLFLLLSVFYFVSYSQDSSVKNLFVPTLNTYFGSVIKSYPKVPESKFASLYSIEFNLQSQGKSNWQSYCHFPKFGVETVFGSFNNPNELGYTIGLVPVFEMKSKHIEKKWRFKLGLGACYFNKPFDLVTNPNNFYIGGKFANMTILNLYWNTTISNKIALKYGLVAIHSSNGHTALPNAGMNILAANIGLSLVKKANRIINVNNDSLKQNNFYTLKFGLGIHEFGSTTKAVGGPSYPSYHVSFWYNKPFKNIHLLQIGFTGAYYTSFYDYIVSQEVYNSNQKLMASTGIVFIGHEFVMGKVGFVTQAGFYCFNPFYIKQKKLEGTWSSVSNRIEAFSTNRLGLVYYPMKKLNTLNNLKNQLHLGVYIKANLGQADLFEYALGYTF